MSRITARKYMGDDRDSWAVFVDGRPVVTGLNQASVAYYKRVVAARLDATAQAPAPKPAKLTWRRGGATDGRGRQWRVRQDALAFWLYRNGKRVTPGPGQDPLAFFTRRAAERYAERAAVQP